MANGRPLVVDPYTTASGGTQAVYALENSTAALHQIGPDLPSGETAPSAALQSTNWSANAAVQIGDFVYAIVNGVLYRYDYNNPSDGWTTYHTIASGSGYIKGGLFNFVINGEDYLAGIVAVNSTTARAYKIKLADDTITTLDGAITTLTFAFRDCLQFRGRLYFRNGTSPIVGFYDPKANYIGTCGFQSSSFEGTGAGGRQTLVTYNDALYNIGYNATSGALGVSIWRLDESTNTFQFLNALSIDSNGTNLTTTKEVAFVNPSTTYIRETLTSGVSQSIFYLSFGPNPVTPEWRLYEIYPTGVDTFSSYQWTDAFNTTLSDAGSGWGVAPFPNERYGDGDTKIFLYYTPNKQIVGTTSVEVYEFLPEVPDIVLDHPFLSLLGSGGDWSHMNLPHSIDGGGEKLSSDGTDTATARITRLEKISETTWRISYKLWHGFTSDFSIIFNFSTDQEVPKSICTLSNPSHGTIGTGPSRIDGVSADDGVEEYTVEWDATSDGVNELDWIRLTLRSYTPPIDTSPPDNYTPAYDIKNINYNEIFTDSVSSSITFKNYDLNSLTTSLASSIGFKHIDPNGGTTSSISESIGFEIPDALENTATFTGEATADIIFNARVGINNITFTGDATPTVLEPRNNTATFTGDASATKEANVTVNNTVNFTGIGTEASELTRQISSTFNLTGTASPIRIWERSTDNQINFSQSVTVNEAVLLTNSVQFTNTATPVVTQAVTGADIVVYGSLNYQTTDVGTPQGGVIALSTKIITIPVQFGRVEIRSSSALDRDQYYLIEGFLRGGYPTSQILPLSGLAIVSTTKNIAVMRISKISGSPLVGQVTVQVNSQDIGILDRDPHGSIEVLELRRLFYQTYGVRDSNKMFYEKVFIRNNHPQLTLTHINISQAIDEDETIEFAFDNTVNGASTSISRISRPEDIPAAQFTDIPRVIPDIAPGEAIGMWLRIVVPQGQTSAVVV